MEQANDTYTKREYRRNKRIFFVIKLILIAAYLFIIFFVLFMNQRTTFSVVSLVIITLMCFLVFRLLNFWERRNSKDIKRNENTWGKGFKAEDNVGNSLKTLSSEFKVIEDFNTGHGNIDFIVIGPTGLFTIEVKARKGTVSYKSGQVYINNRLSDKDFIAQTKAEKFWIMNALKQNFNIDYPVIGLLEFPFGKIDKFTISGPIKDNIWIGEGNFHRYIIDKSRNHLTPEEVDRIYTFLASKKENKTV